MSGTLAHYAFIPWIKEGIGNRIQEQDALGDPAAHQAKERAELAVEINLESTDVNDATVTISNPITKNLKLLGPPDILGFSKSAVIRTEPKPKVNNFEASGLPYIEFYQENFLWNYSPAAPNQNRVTPWLALICLKDDEFELANTSDGRPYISINPDKIEEVFHDQTQHWAWAHVQMATEIVAGNQSAKIQEVKSELEENPDAGLSRLMCPRKSGRLAGLKQDFAGVLAQSMSWGGVKADYETKTRGFDYPVYYQWTFRTGKLGDFETMARLLEPFVSAPELGKRPMYIANAGYGLEDSDPETKVLGLEGALKPPGFTSDPWTNGSKDVNYRNHLRKL